MDADQSEEAMAVEEPAAASNGSNVEFSLADLREWATKEKLGARFNGGLENIIESGGLTIVTDQYLQSLGIMLPGMRVKIIEACKRKLGGVKKKTRFGETLWFDPVLKTRPTGKCAWTEIDHIETGHDKETYRAAFRTWRFCATGVDGFEEEQVLRDGFESWRSAPPENPVAEFLQDLLQGLGAFFTAMPCCGSRS